MQKIVILGSTGSIGRQTLDVIQHLGSFEVVGLAAYSNVELLQEQISLFHPKYVVCLDEKAAVELQKKVSIPVWAGIQGACALAELSEVNVVVSAFVGVSAIRATFAALKSGKKVALANKETLVSAGELAMKLSQKAGAVIIPVDSEHSAIFQALLAGSHQEIDRLILTASGGPFLSTPSEALSQITPAQALRHPNWKMGPKITVDSSTLLNKGLEVIEAHHLFDIPYEKIEVIIHPESIVHSIVQYVDQSLIAQMGAPSMITPIQYALTYPERKPSLLERFDLMKVGSLQFLSPDLERFRCLKLAVESGRRGESYPAYMNAAAETLVNRFLQHQISWVDIGKKLDLLLARHVSVPLSSIDVVEEVSVMAAREAISL